jgi:hypothetical protein
MCVTQQMRRSSEADAVDGSNERPARAWAGHGKGTRCDHCHRPIEADQVEYEVELLVDKHPKTVTVHLDCYEEWILLQHPSSLRSPTAAENVP